MKKKIPLLVTFVLLIAALGFGGFYFNEFKKVDKKYKELVANSPAEVTKRLLEKVGLLIELPKDETPSVATVEDKDKLKDQPFFAGAEKGDRLLIYQGAKKAIVYREATNKVINVGPIAIQQTNSQKVLVKIVGKEADRNAVQKVLETKFTDKLTITKADGATNSSTTVVDVTEGATQTDNVTAIVGSLKNAKPGSLPSGDTKPADQNVVIYAGPQE